MGLLLNLLLVILAVVLRSTVNPELSIFGVSPDLVLLVLIYIGIAKGQIQGTIFGFLAGFLIDVYSPESLGLNALVNSSVGFAVGFGHRGVVIESLSVQVLVLFSAVLMHDLLYFLIYSRDNLTNAFYLFLLYGPWTAMYTTGVGLVLILAFSIRWKGGFYIDVSRLFRR